jgi:hypothetical protein
VACLARLLSALVVGEVALALLLLVGGSLVAKSFARRMRVDTGIRADGVLTFRFSLSGPRYDTPERRTEFFRALFDRLRRIPGLTGAAGVSPLPMSREFSGGGFGIEGRAAPANWRDMSAQYCQATPRFYYPIALRPPRSLSVAVRTAGRPLDVVSLVRQQVRALGGDLPLDRLRPMTEVVSDSISDMRFVTSAVGGFAAFALALAAIGLYGVIAYSVSRRRHEIGIRLALGASRGQVLTLVLGRGALLASAGIVVGVPAALAATRLVASFLYGVRQNDVSVFVAVPSVLMAVALVASYLPARTAAAVDSAVSLHIE